MVLPLAATVAVLRAVIGLIIQLSNRSPNPLIDNTDPNNPQFHWHRIDSLLSGSLAGALVSTVLVAVLTGMLIVVVTEDVVGRRADFGLVWRKARSRIWRLVGLSLVIGVLQFVGLLLCLAPGIWLWGIWAVAVPALMIENRGIGGALGRSRQLVGGMFWRVWGIRALGYLIAGAISAAIGLLFGLIGWRSPVVPTRAPACSASPVATDRQPGGARRRDGGRRADHHPGTGGHRLAALRRPADAQGEPGRRPAGRGRAARR